MSPNLKIISYNVRGLSACIKRANILGELKSLKAEVAMLQETHLSTKRNQIIYSRDFPEWYYSDSPIRGARGVAIGFARDTRFELEERLSDPEGRYLFLKGKINGRKYSLANIYGPNKNTYRTVMTILSKFETFKTGRAIVGGDFNLCLDPERDCTSRARGRGGVWPGKLKNKLHQLQLVDVWRIQQGDTRDYTFYSPVHGTYSRLDFFLIEHRMLEETAGATIGNMTFSDHAPVSLFLRVGETVIQSTGWRLNEDLLADSDTLKRIKEELEWFFKINTPGEVNEATIWEAHKTYIRGIIMMIGGEKNKRLKNQRLALTKEIHKLEQQHEA